MCEGVERLKNGNWRINLAPCQLHSALRKKFLEIRLRAQRALGNKCVRCGYKDERALQIDHVNGGGKKERTKYRGASYYYHVLKEIAAGRGKKYQILCANCNVIKRRENQEIKLRYPKDVKSLTSGKP
jgi:hypothetical protein